MRLFRTLLQKPELGEYISHIACMVNLENDVWISGYRNPSFGNNLQLRNTWRIL